MRADTIPGDPAFYPWRVGRRTGRTIYAVLESDLDGDGWLIGSMDTAELARAAVDAHNEWLNDAS